MGRAYGMVQTSDGNFILDRSEFDKGYLNTYKTIFAKIWPILKDDDRIKYVMFMPDDNFQGGICIQLWLHRGTVFSPGPVFEEDHSNDNSVIASFLGKWLQVPPSIDEKEQYEGKFNGKTIKFNREYAGYRMTDDECKRLLDGETIVLTLKGSDGEYRRAGKLGEGEYGGFKYYGFIWDKSVKFCPSKFARHTFTQQELNLLESGESLVLDDLWSSKKNKYFKARIIFNKDTGKIEFAHSNNSRYDGFGNGDADSY